MLGLNQTLKGQTHRTGLTSREKDIVVNVYNDCIALELKSFAEVVVSYKVKRIDSSISLKLVCSLVAELEAA